MNILQFKLIQFKKQGIFTRQQKKKLMITPICCNLLISKWYEVQKNCVEGQIVKSNSSGLDSEMERHWIFQTEKILEGLKSLQNQSMYLSKLQKSRGLTSKETINEIKHYFDIDLPPASVRFILIKYGY